VSSIFKKISPKTFGTYCVCTLVQCRYAMLYDEASFVLKYVVLKSKVYFYKQLFANLRSKISAHILTSYEHFHVHKFVT